MLSHQDLLSWNVVAVWTTTTDTTASVVAVFHTEPRSGDLMISLAGQMRRRKKAARKGVLVTLFNRAGMPVAIAPDRVTSIRIELWNPDETLADQVAPGYLDREGPVERDGKGALIPQEHIDHDDEEEHGHG